MELKFADTQNSFGLEGRFNCTFMELKSYSVDLQQQGAPVLIVPLWN